MNGIRDMVNSPITLDRNPNETIKNVFLLYNGISEQYNDPEIQEKIRSLIPEQILQLSEDDIQGKWVHMGSTLAYPISVNHPYYCEELGEKVYEYVLAFSSSGRVEDVTQRYTQDFDAVTQRRKKNKSSMKKLFLA